MNPDECVTRRRLQCINCNICVNTLRRFIIVELDTRVISIISDWIAPTIITDNDYICEACRDIAMHRVDVALTDDNSIEQALRSSQQGHRHVCILCGLSILRCRSDLILKPNGSDLDRNIANIIESRIALHQITSSDRVCHPCWLKCRRTAIQVQQVEDSRSSHQESYSGLESNLTEQGVETVEEIPETQNSYPAQQMTKISLPNYRRAANTASHCLFTGCNNNGLHTMSDSLRATILNNYNYYIPPLARICMEHLCGNDWEDLYNSPGSISTFTVQQTEHVFSIVNKHRPFLDCNSIEGIQDMDLN